MSLWHIESFFLDKVDEGGGFVCHHAHFDKAHLITEEGLKLSQSSLQEKWKIYRQLKGEYTEYTLHSRMARCIEHMIYQGGCLNAEHLLMQIKSLDSRMVMVVM